MTRPSSGLEDQLEVPRPGCMAASDVGTTSELVEIGLSNDVDDSGWLDGFSVPDG